MDKFHEMKKEVAVAFGAMCCGPIENTADGIHGALADILEHGTYEDGAKAVMMAAQWMWADCEERYHASTPTVK